jgi:hypothetical protein
VHSQQLAPPGGKALIYISNHTKRHRRSRPGSRCIIPFWRTMMCTPSPSPIEPAHVCFPLHRLFPPLFSRGTSDIFLFFLCFTVSVSTFSQHVGFPDVSHSPCDVPSCGVTDRRGIPLHWRLPFRRKPTALLSFPFLSSVPLSLSVDPILLRFPLCRFGVFSVILLPLYRRPSPVPIHYTHCHSRHRSIASQGGCAVFEHIPLAESPLDTPAHRCTDTAARWSPNHPVSHLPR